VAQGVALDNILAEIERAYPYWVHSKTIFIASGNKCFSGINRQPLEKQNGGGCVEFNIGFRAAANWIITSSASAIVRLTSSPHSIYSVYILLKEAFNA
jgi:hypothetical protein